MAQVRAAVGQDFLKKFYSQLETELKMEINIAVGFLCSWEAIINALTDAVGDDAKVL